MSVTVRPYRRRGWEVDIRLTLPDNSEHRERRKAPVSSRSAAQRWGEDRERHWYQELTQPRPPDEEKKEVPTLETFWPRFLDGYPRANRQKPSGIAAKETIGHVHLIPVLGGNRWIQIRTEILRQMKNHPKDRAPKPVNTGRPCTNVM